jgi:hypothetical protein
MDVMKSTRDQSDVHSAFLRRVRWIVAATLAIVVLTAPAASSPWEVPLSYFAMALLLGVLVRAQNPDLERLAHIVVLAGTAPLVVRSFVGVGLSGIAFVHIGALMTTAVGAGYLVAEVIRPRGRKARVISRVI